VDISEPQMLLISYRINSNRSDRSFVQNCTHYLHNISAGINHINFVSESSQNKGVRFTGRYFAIG